MHRAIPSCEGQTEKNAPFVNMWTIHPFMRRTDTLYHTLFFGDHDSSPPAKGRPHPDNVCLRPVRFIPSCEGQASVGWMHTDVMVIHPFLRRADTNLLTEYETGADSSLPTKGSQHEFKNPVFMRRFIPSYEGQPLPACFISAVIAIHPFLRRAATQCLCGFQPL